MRRLGVFLLLLSFLVSCKSWQFESVGNDYIKVSEATEDSALLVMIHPYKQQLDSVMQTVIAHSEYDLRKSRPAGTLGNWMADACMRQAQKITGTQPDLGLFNYGGIRKPFLNKGEVTLGMMFELMPFDNQMVVIELEGRWLIEALNWVMKKGGEPISGVILNIKTQDVHFNNGRLLFADSLYQVVTNDFMMEGGDGYTMLSKGKSVKKLGLLRDALIEDMISNPLRIEDLEERRVLNE